MPEQGREIWEMLTDNPDMLYTTNFRRCWGTTNLLARLAKDVPGTDTPMSCVIVGVGRDAGPIEQPYEPYLVHSRLTALGIPFSLTLIDRDQTVLDLIKRRRRIFLSQTPNLLRSVSQDNAWWQKFLAETGQTDTMVHKIVAELTFRPAGRLESDSRFLGTRDYLMWGFRVTDVPAAFVEEVASSTIQLKTGDITAPLIAPTGKTDLISCRNVLCHLPPEDQVKAVWNMAQMVRPGGHIFINDFQDQKTRSMLEKHGGWMSEDFLQNDFSLRMTVLAEHDAWRYTDLLLTKM